MEQPLVDEQRTACQGTIDQIRLDLEELAKLGAEYVLLDTDTRSPDDTVHLEKVWAMRTTLAEQVFDLPRQALRYHEKVASSSQCCTKEGERYERPERNARAS